MNYKARHKARVFAMQALYQWAYTREDLFLLQAQFRARNDYHKYVDWEWFERLVNGVFAANESLNQLIEKGSKRSLQEINPVELAILRLGIFELKSFIEVPYQVVLSEYVDIAGEFGSSEGHQFVNAALESLAKELRELEYEAKLKEQNDASN